MFLVKCANIIQLIALPLHLQFFNSHFLIHFLCDAPWSSYRLYKVVIHGWRTHSAPCKWSTESRQITETVFLQCE